MIKARMTKADGGSMFIFGLSDGNIAKLRKGQPIFIDLESLGGPTKVTIGIHWGETEAAIVREFVAAGLIDTATKVTGE
jgi:hypothetical protein